MRVTKEHAALAQLETAIWLYFEDIDPVSVHTLANAAGEALDGCCDAAGQASMWSVIKGYVKPEHWKEIQTLIRASYNHFKHGSKPTETVEFSDDQNIFFLFRACMNVRALEIESVYCAVFLTWLAAVEPKWLHYLSDFHGIVQKAYGDIVGKSRENQKIAGRLILSEGRGSFRS